ncbi:unnamed protein product [Closterium sp. NIES-64]|nr:unnamed protein product [Closterium sp. NIES-64]
MPRLYHRSQLALHIKRAICAQHVANPLLRHVDLARWCFMRFGVRPDRSTIGRVLKGADRWHIPDDAVDAIRVRGGAYPDLERAMARWIANAGLAGVPLTLATIRDHVATMARANGAPPTFRCSIGWVRRALRRQGVRCMSAVGEAADQDLKRRMIAMTKARYRQHWLRAFTGMWTADGATSAAARFKPNLRLVLEWLHDAWMNIPQSTIQRCWWRTECLPRAWAMELPHVEQSAAPQVQAGSDIGLDEEVNDVGVLIDRLCLGPSAMPAAEFVGIDDNQPTCAEPGEDPLARDAGVGADGAYVGGACGDASGVRR